MIYVLDTPRSEGRINYWTVLADTTEELVKAVQTAGAYSSVILYRGAENEMAVLTTTQKNKLKDTEEIDQRGLVKIIRTKRAAPPATRSGGVRITTKAAAPEPEDEDEDADADLSEE